MSFHFTKLLKAFCPLSSYGLLARSSSIYGLIRCFILGQKLGLMRINQSAIKPYNTAKYELSYLEFAKLSQTNKVFVSKIEFILINKSS